MQIITISLTKTWKSCRCMSRCCESEKLTYLTSCSHFYRVKEPRGLQQLLEEQTVWLKSCSWSWSYATVQMGGGSLDGFQHIESLSTTYIKGKRNKASFCYFIQWQMCCLPTASFLLFTFNPTSLHCGNKEFKTFFYCCNILTCLIQTDDNLFLL